MKPARASAARALLVATAVMAGAIGQSAEIHGTAQSADAASCFLLYEIGVGQVRRSPGEACATRVSPASTFKIPHALAALDTGVLDGPDARIAHDGTDQPFVSWRRDHTLRTAIRDSVVWYFQRVAERLGAERERAYLEKFRYGSADPTSGLTTFWLGGSLLISPDEQQRFLLDLFADRLPVERRHMETVRQLMVQPAGTVVNAAGSQKFGPATGVVVAAKTGAVRDRSGQDVRWLVGRVERGSRSWIFVAMVKAAPDAPAAAALELAASGLTEAKVF